MITYDITLNGVKVQKAIPTKYEEVSFKNFIALEDNKEITAVSLFTGIDKETLKKANISNLDSLLKSLSFLQTPPALLNIPDEIAGIKVSKDIGFEAFGMFTDLKDELDKGLEGMELLKQYPLFCAIYCTRPYDFMVSQSRVEEFENMPCVEVLALGNFLLMKLVALKSITAPTSLKPLTLLRKVKLALISWRARLAFQVRFFIWKRKASTPLSKLSS